MDNEEDPEVRVYITLIPTLIILEVVSARARGPMVEGGEGRGGGGRVNRSPHGARGCRRRGYGMPRRGIIGAKQAKKEGPK